MEKTKQVTVCATGHRPADLPSDYGYDYRNARWSSIIADTKKIIKSLDAHRAISGMALGYDTAFAVAVLQLQNEGYKITLEAAVPCKGQADAWTDAAKKLYKAILARCAKVTVLSNTYTKKCMQDRNEYMVDNSDAVIAMFDTNKTSGGTYNCIRYAQKAGKKVYNVLQTLPANISFIEKDILDTTANLVLQQVNCIGAMGRGLARQIRADLSEESYRYYRTLCLTHGKALLGGFLSLPSKSVPNRTYINIFSQNTIGTETRQTRYDKLEQAFIDIDNSYQNERIAIPYKMACGLGGGDWNIVLGLIKKCFKKNLVEIYRLSSKSDFTHHETKSDLNKGSRKGDKNMEKLDLSSLEVGAEKKIHILDLLNQEEEREEAYFLEQEEKSRNANSFELYITQDPRKGFLDIDLFTNLYNFCIKAIKSRLVMILDLEKVISSLVNIEEYTYGFKENPTVTQAESLKAFYRDIKAKLSDKKVKEFIKVNNDYTVFGCDDATRCDYITTYQKVIRLLTNTCGESLEFYKDVINNVKDELQSIILDNTYEVETISLVENEESEDSLEYAY